MLSRVFRILAICSGILLVAAAHTGAIDPQDFWPASFPGLAFMSLFIFNIALLLVGLFRWSPTTFVSFTALMLSMPTISRYTQINIMSEMPEGAEGDTIKIMSYNVRVFDLYNWTENGNSKQQIMEFLQSENPGILCLQEFFHSDKKGYFATRDTLSKVLNDAEQHIHYTTTLRGEDHWGIATYSQFPIIGRGHVELPEAWNNVCIYTDVVISEDTFRVYNAHLASIGLKASDYTLLEDINDKEDEKEVERTKGILDRMKRAFIKRSIQAKSLKEHMNESPYTVILCGDFNDPPSSFTYRVLRKGLSDGFVEKGNGMGITYPVLYPGYRIDYILTEAPIRPVAFRTVRKKLSDHYPVILHFFGR